MKTYNRTSFKDNEIAAQPILAIVKDNWRQRAISLHRHPADPSLVVSVGVSFDGETVVIVEEPHNDWAVALEYGRRSEIYVTN